MRSHRIEFATNNAENRVILVSNGFLLKMIELNTYLDENVLINVLVMYINKKQSIEALSPIYITLNRLSFPSMHTY